LLRSSACIFAHCRMGRPHCGRPLWSRRAGRGFRSLNVSPAVLSPATIPRGLKLVTTGSRSHGYAEGRGQLAGRLEKRNGRRVAPTGFVCRHVRPAVCGPARGGCAGRPPRPARSTYRQNWFQVGFRPRIATARRRTPIQRGLFPLKQDGRPRRPNGRPLSARGRENCEERTPLWARALVAPFPRERSAVRKSTSLPAPGVPAQRRRLPQGRLSLGEREETSTL
jgi:hypothetical protein